MPNVSCLENSSDRNIKTQIGLKNYALQANIATDTNRGISSSLYYVNSFESFPKIKPGYALELARVFFKNNEHKYFELQIGGGYTNNNFLRQKDETNITLSKCKYVKLFAQPSLFVNNKKISFGTTVKISPIFFTNYYFYQEKMWSKSVDDHDNRDAPDYITYYTIEETKRKNIFACVIEPAFTIRKNGKLKKFIQFVGVISPKTIFKNAYEYGYHSFPTNAVFVVNVGLEYDFSSKKNMKKLE